MPFERIIVVDDDPVIRRMLVNHLQKQIAGVLGVATAQQGLDEQKKEPADLLIVDLQLPDSNGLEFMQAAKALGQPVEVIIMTGFGTIESAVEAMKLGAANYLLKPFTLAQFDVAVQQLLEQRQLRHENAYLKEQITAENDSSELLFQSAEMARIDRLVQRVAPTNATVLIQGESGTGKELIAHSLYQHSLRREKPYVKVNCAAVPENLLESEFFGHEKGSFTGATSRREGRFELANGGTLLLDEVTEISLGLQAKLLRVLQEQEFERVGGNRTIHVDVRIIATTNRDLALAVEEGKFRQDLFFRLNVVPLKIPPLRERKGEVEFLLNSFLTKFARKHRKEPPTISPLAIEQLAGYPWPGNVRELQNYTERAVIMAEAGRELTFGDFVLTAPPTTDSVLDTGDGLPTVAEMERRLIQLVMKKTKGHRNEAARLLGINVRTLRNKLHEYGNTTEDASETNGDANGNGVHALNGSEDNSEGASGEQN